MLNKDVNSKTAKMWKNAKQDVGMNNFESLYRKMQNTTPYVCQVSLFIFSSFKGCL